MYATTFFDNDFVCCKSKYYINFEYIFVMHLLNHLISTVTHPEFLGEYQIQ